MPVHRVGSMWQWGKSGTKYKSKKDAEKQAAAIYANGWKGEDDKVKEATESLAEVQAILTGDSS